jgi:hypothetical protein
MQLLRVPERSSSRSRRAGSSQQPAPPVFSQDSDSSSAAEQEAAGSGSRASIAAALCALKGKDDNKQGELLARLVTAGVADHHGGEEQGCALSAHWLGSDMLCSHPLPRIRGGCAASPPLLADGSSAAGLAACFAPTCGAHVQGSPKLIETARKLIETAFCSGAVSVL